ncbi:CSN7 COP9 signalosome subunit, partial [Neohortaea acidophila]
MDQSLALNALAPYIALAKSATSPRAAADLITQATSAANTYVFAELLQHSNIQTLQENPEYRSYYTLLAIFSWGTWETYNQTPDLPALSDAQLLKLRLLSLLTIASDRHATTSSTPRSSNLSYASLCALLGLATPLDLEHLITQAIYSNLLTATLNPASQTVHITAVSPLRDLAPGSVGVMTTELEAWSLRCQSVLATLDAEIAKVRGAAARRAMREQKAEKQIKVVVDSA